MKQSLRVLVFSIFTFFGTFLFTGCFGSSGSVTGLEPETTFSLSGPGVKKYSLVSLNSGKYGQNEDRTLWTKIVNDTLRGDASVSLYGDSLMITRVSSDTNFSNSGTVYIYLWIEGRFIPGNGDTSLTSVYGSAISRGIPAHARTSPEGASFEYQLTHTVLENVHTSQLSIATLHASGLTREITTARYQGNWEDEQTGKTMSTWQLSIVFKITPLRTF